MDKKTLFGCSLGNIFEWYDFMVYGGLSPILSTVFFPKENHFLGVMITLAIFAAGFLMRPLGGIFFGHMADTHGRKKALIVSIMLIGFPSLGVVLLPSYQTIGIIAPILLLLFRLIQGFSIGGELPGLITYLAETSPAKKRGYYCSYGSIIPALGILSATLVVYFLNKIISHENMLTWGWRIPFLISIFLIIIGFYFRSTLLESPIFVKLKTDQKIVKRPIIQALKSQKTVMMQIFLFGMFIAIPYYSFNIFTVTYLTTFVHFDYASALIVSIFGTVSYIAMLPLCGVLADRFGRKKLINLSCIGLIIFIYPIYILLNANSVALALLAQFIFALFLSPYCAAEPAFIAEQVDSRLRCTVMGFSYSLAMAIFGGTAPMINTFLIESSRSDLAPSYYVIFSAIVGFMVTFKMKDLTGLNLDTVIGTKIELKEKLTTFEKEKAKS